MAVGERSFIQDEFETRTIDQLQQLEIDQSDHASTSLCKPQSPEEGKRITMTMGEIFQLAALLEVLFSRLASHDFLNYARQEGVTKKLEKWRETVSEIKQLLRDAEEKQLIMSEAMHQWLIELTHLAYDVDDILDKFSTQMLAAAMDESGASSSMVRIFIPKIKLFSYNSEMEGLIAHRLLKLSARQNELLKNVNSNSESTTSLAELQWSPVSIALKTPEAKGDGEIQKIIRLLSRDCEPSLALARLQIYKCRKIQDRYNSKTTYSSIPCVQIGEKYTHSHS